MNERENYARITVIEPTIDASTNLPILNSIKEELRHMRVSTDSDEQYTSYEAQVERHKDIKERTDWEYVDTYADEGISGTYPKEEKLYMIADALSGKIDLSSPNRYQDRQKHSTLFKRLES